MQGKPYPIWDDLLSAVDGKAWPDDPATRESLNQSATRLTAHPTRRSGNVNPLAEVNMTRNCGTFFGLLTLTALLGGSTSWTAGQAPLRTELPRFPRPEPMVPGAKVVILWPPGSPMLKALRTGTSPKSSTGARGHLVEWSPW